MSEDAPGLTILFADVCRSTELFEQLGDVRARTIIGEALDAVARIVEQRGGTVIKSLGDELMCTFASPVPAAEAAVEMQRAVPRPLNEVVGGLQLRIGFHHGEVLQEHGDVFGDAVNVAARLAGLAKAAQVLASSAAAAAAGPIASRGLGEMSLKGRQQPVAVSEVLWQADQSELTAVAGTIV